MAQITQKISVQVSKPNFFQAIVAKQYDNGSRFLQATLLNGSEKINIAPSSSVLINARRNDGEEASFGGTVNGDGTVTVPLTAWILELEGRVESDITVIDADERKLTSTKFIVEVERASCKGEDITEDENYDVLITALGEVAKTRAEAIEATEAANEAALAAVVASSAANAATANATTAINRMNTALNEATAAFEKVILTVILDTSDLEKAIAEGKVVLEKYTDIISKDFGVTYANGNAIIGGDEYVLEEVYNSYEKALVEASNATNSKSWCG